METLNRLENEGKIARELSPERARELHEISGTLMNRVKLN